MSQLPINLKIIALALLVTEKIDFLLGRRTTKSRRSIVFVDILIRAPNDEVEALYCFRRYSYYYYSSSTEHDSSAVRRRINKRLTSK